MNLGIDTARANGLSTRLCDRLKSLGVTLLRLTPKKAAATPQGCRWIEKLLISSVRITQEINSCWEQIENSPGQVVRIAPGVMLVPLPMRRRRRINDDDQPGEVLAVLLLGPELVTGDLLHHVCSQAGVDYRATVARIDLRTLVDAGEAQRLATMLSWMHEDAGELDGRVSELHSMSRELAESYEELSLLYKLSTGMMVNQPPADFLEDACRELQQVVGVRWFALQLVEDEPRLLDLAGRVFTAGPIESQPEILRKLGKKLLNQVASNGEPEVVDDSETLAIPALSRLASNLVVVPLMEEDRPLGVLFGGDKLDDSRLTSVDSKLCESMCNSLSIFLQNTMLYEDMQAMFLGTLHALTSAIDAKDSYTHGHSERVALTSRMLAEAAGLDEHTVERIYIAGLVHDVGKIGVPESVLCKPGRLTDEEFDLIKMHPEIGARILQDIRQMQDLIPGVLCHHERHDGTGYPHGLEGEGIPLFGRIIALADAFDAMSSNRTYRRALQPDQVLAEIAKNAGTQFDPTLAKLFVKLDFEQFYDMIQRHRATDETARNLVEEGS